MKMRSPNLNLSAIIVYPRKSGNFQNGLVEPRNGGSNKDAYELLTLTDREEI